MCPQIFTEEQKDKPLLPGMPAIQLEQKEKNRSGVVYITEGSSLVKKSMCLVLYSTHVNVIALKYSNFNIF